MWLPLLYILKLSKTSSDIGGQVVKIGSVIYPWQFLDLFISCQCIFFLTSRKTLIYGYLIN